MLENLHPFDHTFAGATMKKHIMLSLFLTAFLSLNCMGLDELSSMFGGGLDDPFGDISLHDGYGGHVGGDPFGGFDNLGNGGFDDLFGGSNDFGTPAAQAGKKEKKITAPDAKTPEEAFTKTLPDGLKKIPKIYKEGADQALSELIHKLHGLHANLSSTKLNIALRTQLQDAARKLNDASSSAQLVHDQSVYHKTLYSKDFSKLRTNIAKAGAEIDKVVGLFNDLAVINTKPLEAPSARVRRAQSDAQKKAEKLIERTVTPLHTDLEKILSDKSAKSRIEARQKKYKEREKKVAAPQAQSYGGWSGDAGGYFNDNWGGDFGSDFGGFSGGWDDFGGSGWDNFGGWDSFGGGYDSGYSSYGSGGASSWGSHSSASSGSTPSQSLSPSSSPVKLPSMPNSSNTAPQTSTPHPVQYAQPTPSEDLSPREVAVKAARTLPERLKHWREFVSSAKNPHQLEEKTRAMLEQRAFSRDIMQLALLHEALTEPEVEQDRATDRSFAANVEKCHEAVHASLKLLVAAAKYASPPFSVLIDEHHLMQKKKLDRKTAKKKAAALKKQRQRSYEALMQWLQATRLSGDDALMKKIVTLLRDDAAQVLSALEKLLDSAPDSYLPYETAEQIDVLSRRLLQEPVVIGYSAIPKESPEDTHRRKKQLVPLITRKQKVAAQMGELLTEQNELITTMLNVFESAIQKVQKTLSSTVMVEDWLTQPENIKLLEDAMLRIIKEHHSKSPYAHIMQQVMLPYTEETFKKMHIQLRMQEELLAHWKPAVAVPTFEKPGETAQAFSDITDGSLAIEKSHEDVIPEPGPGSTSIDDPALADLPKELQDALTALRDDEASAKNEMSLPDDATMDMNSTNQVHGSRTGFLDRMAEKARSSGLLGKIASGAQKFGSEVGSAVVQDVQSAMRNKVRKSVYQGINNF